MLLIALLLENSNRFRQNLKRMATLTGSVYRYRIDDGVSKKDVPWSDYFRDPSLDKKLFRDVSRCKQLYMNNVVGVLGAGSEGIAFELDDGSVLKLGQMHTGIKPDNYKLTSVPWKYRNAGDLHVHDAGRAHVSTEKLVPFEEILRALDGSDEDNITAWFDELMHEVVISRRAGVAPDLRAVPRPKLSSSQSAAMVDGIIAAFERAANGRSIDLHPGNLGYRPSDGKFVFYDF